MRSCARKSACLLFLSLASAAVFISPVAGDEHKYDSHDKRDPFVPLIGIEKPEASRLEDMTSITDVKLEGIAGSPGGTMIAILNGEIVKEGDIFGNIEIKNITKKAVTVMMSGKNYNIDLTE